MGIPAYNNEHCMHRIARILILVWNEIVICFHKISCKKYGDPVIEPTILFVLICSAKFNSHQYSISTVCLQYLLVYL
jgi:hypothetical protein